MSQAVGLAIPSLAALWAAIGTSRSTPTETLVLPAMENAFGIPQPFFDIGVSYVPQEIEVSAFHMPEYFASWEFGVLIVLIWAIGAITYGAASMYGYRRFRQEVLLNSTPEPKCQSPIPVLISESPSISTPMLVGIIRPFIVLPSVVFGESELSMILAHELVHYRRKDVGLKFLMLITTAIHWFNPAVYFIKKHIDVQCELSCDEQVVMEMSPQKRQLYGETILFMLQRSVVQRNLVCASGLCNSKKNIKMRLLNMLNAKKTKKYVTAVSIAMAASVVVLGGIAAYGLSEAMPEVHADTYPEAIEYNNAHINGRITEYTPGLTGLDRRIASMGVFYNMEDLIAVRESVLAYANGDQNRLDQALQSQESDNMIPSLLAFNNHADFRASHIPIEFGSATHIYLQTILSPELADALYGSIYFNAYTHRDANFRNFFVSDQFIQILEAFGESFVTDFLARDIESNFALLLGDTTDAFLAKAYAVDSEAILWGEEQLALFERESALRVTGWEVARARTLELDAQTRAMQRMFEEGVVAFVLGM